MVSLRKVVSDSTLATSCSLWKGEDDLKEPSLKDFMSLSDDDIADDRPATPERQLHLQTPSTPPACSLPPDPLGQSVRATCSTHPWLHQRVRRQQFGRLPRWPRSKRQESQHDTGLTLSTLLIYGQATLAAPQPRASSAHSISYLGTPSVVTPSLAMPSNSLRSLTALHKCLEGKAQSPTSTRAPG